MKQRKRIRQILIIFVLCVLILYVGFQAEIIVSEYEITMEINKILTDKAGQMYLTGFYFSDKKPPDSVNEWISQQVMNMLPLGNYFQKRELYASNVEDKETYEMILARQENDEVFTEQETVPEQTVSTALDKLKDFEYLISNFYTVDSSTSINENMLNVENLLAKDMSLREGEGPKVLIYHTHSQEAFKDSVNGDTSTTIMGMGEYLTKILKEKYGIETLHHEGVYDLINGKLDRSKAYQLAEPQIQKVLKDNPSIEVVIDLHRDGVKDTTHLVTEIGGKQTAKLMFFNGLSRTKANGDIAYLKNQYIEDNLAFSLQMQLAAAEKYPGLTRRIYLKSYRYNMHLMPKTLLIEAGAQTNTVEEMRNAMELLAEILDSVLQP